MQKLLQESKNVEYESKENEGTPIRENDIPQPHPTNHADKSPTRRPVSVLRVKKTCTLVLKNLVCGGQRFCAIQISILTNVVLQIL